MPAQGSVGRPPLLLRPADHEEPHERQRPVLRARRESRFGRRRAAARVAQDLRRRARAPTSACRCARSRRPTRRRRSARRRIRRSPSTTRRARTPIPPRASTSARALPALRAAWIAERGDTVTLDRRRRRPTVARASPIRRSPACASTCIAPPRRAKSRRQRHADALRAPRHRHAGDGVRRDPREPAARRRCSRACRKACAASIAGQSFGAAIPGDDHARVRARRSRARPRDHPEQHQPSRKRADDHRPQLPREDQRQHRQLGRVVVDRRGSREDDVGDPLGRRHGDGSVDRQEHPRDARVDHPQLAGADRHRADLPGAREGRRQGRGADVGNLPRHADRAGRAGRRLLHDPRRRAAALRPADREAHDRHRLARRLDHGEVVPRASPGELPLHALRGDLRDHEGVRRRVLARRRPAPRLDPRRQRRGADGASSRRSAS